MNEIIKIAQNGNNFIKALILILLAVPFTFAVQLIFYLIIEIWVKINKKNGKNNEK